MVYRTFWATAIMTPTININPYFTPRLDWIEENHMEFEVVDVIIDPATLGRMPFVLTSLMHLLKQCLDCDIYELASSEVWFSKLY